MKKPKLYWFPKSGRIEKGDEVYHFDSWRWIKATHQEGMIVKEYVIVRRPCKSREARNEKK